MAKLSMPAFPTGAIEEGKPNSDAIRRLMVALKSFFVRLLERVNVDLAESDDVMLLDGTQAMTAPLGLETYTVATLPAAAAGNAGHIAFVSDGGAGAVFQGSNGTAWVNLG